MKMVDLIALMMEVASTSKMSVNFHQTTRHNNPEDSHLRLSSAFKGVIYNYKNDVRHLYHSLQRVLNLFYLHYVSEICINTERLDSVTYKVL
jgi:hypothetical protein